MTGHVNDGTRRRDLVRSNWPSDGWVTRAGVAPWRGAPPTEDMLRMTIYDGDVTWLEPVQDEEYLASPRK